MKEIMQEISSNEVEEVFEESEIINVPNEEPQLDPKEIISEDFGVICKRDGEVIAYGFWKGTRANNERIKEWAEYGYEKTSEKYVQGYNGKWYIEGTEPTKPAPTNEEISQQRQNAYIERTDPLTLRKLRKQALNDWTSEDEKEYIAQIKAKSEQIEKEFPYNSEEPTL